MVDCMTNNRNRTVGDVRHAFTKCGGNLGTDGSVSYLFSHLGQIIFSPGADEERIMELALQENADDVIVNDDGSMEVTTSPERFMMIRDAMIAAGFQPAHAEATMIAATNVPVTDKDAAEKLMRLTDMLEELDDVQEVYSNADISEEILADLE
jgi:YebC/PmpR family DNA-binding regulatory protein